MTTQLDSNPKRDGLIGSVRVVSKRKGGTTAHPEETVIDVDRVHPVLGNRHYLKNHNDDVERARVVAAHQKDFEQDWARGGPMTQAVKGLAARVLAGERLALRCWCARPDRFVACHANTYRSKIMELVGIHETVSANCVEQQALF